MKQRFNAKKLLSQLGKVHFIDIRITIFHRRYGHDVGGVFKPVKVYIFIRCYHIIADFNVDEFEFASPQYVTRNVSCDATQWHYRRDWYDCVNGDDLLLFRIYETCVCCIDRCWGVCHLYGRIKNGFRIKKEASRCAMPLFNIIVMLV